MLSTCDNVSHMAKMIQIRNVPDEIHREVKARAARAGMSLSDYLRREVERLVAVPTQDEVLARLERLGRVDTGESSVAAVRAARAERDAQLAERLDLS